MGDLKLKALIWLDNVTYALTFVSGYRRRRSLTQRLRSGYLSYRNRRWAKDAYLKVGQVARRMDK